MLQGRTDCVGLGDQNGLEVTEGEDNEIRISQDEEINEDGSGS